MNIYHTLQFYRMKRWAFIIVLIAAVIIVIGIIAGSAVGSKCICSYETSITNTY